LPRRLRSYIEHAARLLPLSEGKRGLANQLRRFLEGAALPGEWRHLRWMVALSDSQRLHLYREGFRAQVAGQAMATIRAALAPAGGDPLAEQMRCDLRLYLPDNILTKIDAMSMATSLEARVPYLDNEVVDLALAIPSRWKLRGGVRKWILKKAFAASLPPTVLQRGKEGFSMPMKNWLNGDWNSLMHELLCRENLVRDGLFEPAQVEALMREHESLSRNHSHVLWAMMVFQLWRDRFAANLAHDRAHVHAA
jgi:asparagine synthase (glutamine-hydrolysing)